MGISNNYILIRAVLVGVLAWMPSILLQLLGRKLGPLSVETLLSLVSFYMHFSLLIISKLLVKQTSFSIVIGDTDIRVMYEMKLVHVQSVNS